MMSIPRKWALKLFVLASPFVGEEHQDNILIDCCCMSYHINLEMIINIFEQINGYVASY